ncbi:MAG TPA: FHA domain-containing protein [Gammaproteobacteria bacterium]|nr:FHA domain-containing protein [Gammaproteobacteria bacterium]
MAKLTLSFKDRKLKVFALPDDGECLIGREPDCTICIDSLAIAPQHARIHPADGGLVIEAASDDAVVQVNDQPLSEAHPLAEGDRIQIGKHLLTYAETSDSITPDAGSVAAPAPIVGWLQIQSGSHLGRTIRLEKAFTRIGRKDGNLAVIAHRDDGFYLSHLQGEQPTQINDTDMGEDAHRLDNGDRVSVGDLQVQYFVDTSAVQESTVPATETTEQRRFSRIPFDVQVTLAHAQDSWDTGLIDISLHGALIKTPQDFASTPDREYRLSVHLEGGPDISMDVQVAHHENEELGLRCKDIDVDSITHLRRLVELNLGDPELLERELSALG